MYYNLEKGEKMKIKVLAVDDNAGQINMLKKYFNRSEKIEIVGSASNGQEAIDIMKSKKRKY